MKSSMPRSAEEAWKRACPPTLRNREALSTVHVRILSTVHVRIFKHSATGVLLHTRMSVHVDVVLLCPTCHITRRRLVTMLSYISLPPRYVSFGRCPSVRACPFTSVVKSCHREDWVFVNKPHCLHTHHMCMCLCLLCLHGEMLPDAIQLQAFSIT